MVVSAAALADFLTSLSGFEPTVNLLPNTEALVDEDSEAEVLADSEALVDEDRLTDSLALLDNDWLTDTFCSCSVARGGLSSEITFVVVVSTTT
ncbi:hypothetical protein K6969_07930 [Streptococcus suis]|uniref:hypothetical protein n=1 Tax=Streptococcus suis TaxID=1307 RepID=UPI000769812C|nr:hypothetical protein [Streptococcus suis]MDY7594557.1 hypothetical protein [Streptococcus suis]MEE3746146.1 hypothetical protein [Streptococcus suis]NQH41454.1 hypothetical protein [Streptococcus suis]QZT28630.1 hypothetical protein K6969_07930 [Streptococcus suis]CYV11017.1 Uncharacterised protein [Streptococcus suis]